MNINVKQTAIVVGFVALVISLGANFMLYVSFSDEGIDRIIYGSMGLLFDFTKVMALPAAAVLWVYRSPILSFIAVLFWITLTGISIGAGFGYMAKVQDEQQQRNTMQSEQYEIAKQSYQDKLNKADGLAVYSTMNRAEIESKMQAILDAPATNSIGSVVGSVGEWSNNCTKAGSYYYDKYCVKYNELKKQLQGVSQYEAVIASKESAATELSTVAASGVVASASIHPLFRYAETLTGYPAATIRVWLLIVSSITCELIASFFLYVGFVIGNKEGKDKNQVRQERSVNPELQGNGNERLNMGAFSAMGDYNFNGVTSGLNEKK